MTKKYHIIAAILLFATFLLNIGPLAYYTIDALVNAELVVEKAKLCMTVLVVLIMSIVAWINKTSSRSKIWVIIFGLYICLDSFLVPLLVIGLTQIVDEWFISPLHRHYRGKYRINREIDKRGL